MPDYLHPRQGTLQGLSLLARSRARLDSRRPTSPEPLMLLLTFPGWRYSLN